MTKKSVNNDVLLANIIKGIEEVKELIKTEDGRVQGATEEI